ncbi:MAG: hypothetical protein P4L44_10555 [Oryzomonas sp.]|uniref:hypothetical protein n=1 Tax=Oryzomonas sp. TaxID=2855186 RepID=UPI002846E442|nr:hypothetical protein [Oryzomonas sp.]MDR3580392.1 hypothetical protein [Oryzomonas sp.]
MNTDRECPASRQLSEEGRISAENSSSSVIAAERAFPSRRFFNWAVIILLGYFGLQLLFFAISIAPFVPPDEATHFGCCTIFSKEFFLPDNSPESYQYGLITNIPWLYYWSMGKLLHVNFFGIPDLLFLRLLNIPLAFGTVFYVCRTLRLLTDDRLSRLLLLVAMTNTLMFSFLSAAVSYDNLANLLAAMAVYYLLAFFKNRSGSLLAFSLLCQLAGGLTKSSFLPLVLVLNVLLCLHEVGNIRELPAELLSWFHGAGRRGLWLLFAILVGTGLNIQLYAGNYLSYGSLAPEIADVLPMKAAMQNRLAAREIIFRLFKNGQVTKEQALAMTGQISNTSDREDTAILIENHDYVMNSGVRMFGLPAYSKLWGYNIMLTVFGIKCHEGLLYDDVRVIVPFVGLFLLSALGFMRRWRPGREGWLPPCMAVIGAFYALFLLYFVCYKAYLYYEQPGIALQGRYIFPVIGPIYVLAICYLMRLFSNRYVRLSVAVATALMFMAANIPLFFSHVTPQWFDFPAG